MKVKVLFILLFPILLLCYSAMLNAQGVAINADGTAADGSAMLDVQATDAGILIPRMTLVQRNGIASPATGLMIYQTDNTAGFYYYNGTDWVRLTINEDERPPKWSGDANTTGTIGRTGNVGIGTTSPGAKLEIRQGMSDYNTAFTAAHLNLGTSNTVDNTGFVGITYDASTAANYGWSSGALRSNSGQSDFIWKHHSSSTEGTERMRVTSTGRLGIGINAPSAQLHTTGTVRFANFANGFLEVDGSGNVGVTDASGLFSAGNGLDWSGSTLNSVWTQSGNNIYNNNSEAVIVNQELSVPNANGASNTIRIADNHMISDHSGTMTMYANRTTGAGGEGSFKVRSHADYDNYRTDFMIETNGNVGIGTTSPNDLLHVKGVIRASNPDNETNYLQIETVPGPYHRIQTTNNFQIWSGGSISFRTSGSTERMRIETNGNVGIGTTNPTFTLHVNGSARVNSLNINGAWDLPTAAGTATQYLRGDGTWGVPQGSITGSGTNGRATRWTGATTLGNSAIFDNGTNIGVGAAQLAAHRIYATQGAGSATIFGNNTFGFTAGLAGVAGAGSNTGTGYLGYYDGTRRAAVYGQAQGGGAPYNTSTDNFAGFFNGNMIVTTTYGSSDIIFDNASESCVRSGRNNFGTVGYADDYWWQVHTGTIFRNNEQALSDASLKQNIRSVENPLGKIMKLSGKIYDINTDVHPFYTGKEGEDENSKNNYGFIAQELMEVIPEMVVFDEGYNYYMIRNYEQLFPIVIEAMKEQQEIIESQQQQIDKQQQQIDYLINEIEKLK